MVSLAQLTRCSFCATTNSNDTSNNWEMFSRECESTANEARTIGNGLVHKGSSVRQGGASCSNLSASRVNTLLSTVNRESAPHRESTSEIVRLFAAQPERNQYGRVCNVCNRIWLCRAAHRHCVHSVSDESRLCDPRERDSDKQS